jgi:hypothetical protein
MKIMDNKGPVYPKFYEVREDLIELDTMVGFYEKRNLGGEKFPSYRKTDNNFYLYLSDNGHWTKNALMDNKEGLIRSKPKGMHSPRNESLWQFMNQSTDGVWDDDSSITVKPLEYPQA